MRITLIILLFLFTSYLFAIDCGKHPIYCDIKVIKPQINSTYAMSLSNKISKVSKKYKLESNLLVAIYARESGFDNNAKRCEKYLRSGNRKSITCHDHGIGQINKVTARSYGFSIGRIHKDLDYSINSSAKILFDFKKMYAKIEPYDWWTRYNSSNKKHRREYSKNVCPFYFGDNYCLPETIMIARRG